ncbi:uncharacterized protein LOC142553867 [Primulina tabacum]|uniref:uncharacterized protein LOC142553867 n=1 Tax=Primulina tabacum TaxID=48773 RepID=UPI003F598F4B
MQSIFSLHSIAQWLLASCKYLQGNYLSGLIPSELGNLSQLQIFFCLPIRSCHSTRDWVSKPIRSHLSHPRDSRSKGHYIALKKLAKWANKCSKASADEIQEHVAGRLSGMNSNN